MKKQLAKIKEDTNMELDNAGQRQVFSCRCHLKFNLFTRINILLYDFYHNSKESSASIQICMLLSR